MYFTDFILQEDFHLSCIELRSPFHIFAENIKNSQKKLRFWEKFAVLQGNSRSLFNSSAWKRKTFWIRHEIYRMGIETQYQYCQTYEQKLESVN